MIPIKCQVCPHYYAISGKWECQRVTCDLVYNEKLRKQVYKALESLGENK